MRTKNQAAMTGRTRTHGNGLWRSTREEAEEGTDEEQSNKTKTTSNLRLGLGGEDGIDFSEFSELEDLLANVADGILGEDNLDIPGFLILGLLLSLLCILFDLLLDFECLFCQLLGILG